MKKNKIHSFEQNTFRWLLNGSVIYWVYRIATHLFMEDNALDMSIDISMLIITIAFIVILHYYNNYNALILTYSLLLVGGYTHFWYRLGGLNGSISYYFFSLITFFIVILPYKKRAVVGVIFCVFTVLLALHIPDKLFAITPLTDSAIILLPFDFIITSIIISIIIVLTKRNFDSESSMLEKNMAHINKLNVEQQLKTKKLLNQQYKIKSIKENLEQMVDKQTAELALSNEQLELYAFHNAHLVRKPLANIIGLISILEAEGADIDRKELSKLKSKVSELDIITKKINFILQ